MRLPMFDPLRGQVGREETRGLLSVSHIKKGVCDKTLKGSHVGNRNVEDLRMTKITYIFKCVYRNDPEGVTHS